jgi:hypothetical protein
MPPRRWSQADEPKSPVKEESELDEFDESDSDYEDSDSEPEVTLNILERQPRITAGMRSALVFSFMPR